MVTRSSSLFALAWLAATALAHAQEPTLPAAAPSGQAAAPSAPATVVAEAPAAAPAETSAASPLPRGELIHAPVSFARIRDAVRIRAAIEHPELVHRAVLVYRAPGSELTEVPFERAPGGPYVAVIPAERVRPPSVGYAIEIEDDSGGRRPAFASRTALHEIEVAEERIDARESAFLARVDGRRSVVAAQADYVSFGESRGTIAGGTARERSLGVADRYFRIEGAYTYRLLRVVSEFGIRVGVVRGRSAVSGAEDTSALDVGLNYAAPNVQFRLADVFHIDAQLLTSLTEAGFSGGAGGAVHLGDVLGSQLVFGFESVSVFGSRVFSRVDVAAAPRVILSVQVEGTDMPHADRAGVRLLGEVAVNVGKGFRIAGRGGYQARDSASGGPAAGLAVSHAF